MTTEELLQKVREIEIRTRHLSQHLFMGGYHSAFKGRGMSFSEVRNYQFGDDVRSIDWNVTARTGEPHIKVFEEERELTVMLMVDVSASSFFGTLADGTTKQSYLTELCAVLAFSASSNHDKVGLLLYADRPEIFIPPAQGRQHILRIIRELLQIKPVGRKTDLEGAFRYLRNVLKQRSILFLLSDFQSEGYEPALRVLARRHDCTGIQVWDTRERELPDMGIIQVLDPETEATVWTDTAHPDLRKQYTSRFDQHAAALKSILLKAGADSIRFNTSEEYTLKLLQFFERRKRH